MIDNKPSPELLEKIKKNEDGFLEIIKARLGIVIRVHQTADLFRTITEACHKFSQTPDDYLRAIRSCPAHSPLIDHLITGITVGETYFFRDKKQISLLTNFLLPRIIEDKRQSGNLNIRIWSAACSTGEEIYTIAMILKDLIPDIKNWSIDLLGTDINKISLQKCRDGVYTAWSMRSIDEFHKMRHFKSDGKIYRLSSEIKQMARFIYLNLHDNAYPAAINGTVSQDLILCRNVMIYFDNLHITQIMQRLNACLNRDGYLLLGASDPVDIIDTSFSFCHEDGAIFFQKEE